MPRKESPLQQNTTAELSRSREGSANEVQRADKKQDSIFEAATMVNKSAKLLVTNKQFSTERAQCTKSNKNLN